MRLLMPAWLLCAVTSLRADELWVWAPWDAGTGGRSEGAGQAANGYDSHRVDRGAAGDNRLGRDHQGYGQ